jgi:signal transduction histidine kinase
MHSIFLDYYFTLLEVLVILFLIGGVGVAVHWGMRRRWRNKLETLRRELADCQAKIEGWRNKQKTQEAVVDQSQSDFLHSDLISGLDYISNQSAQTLDGLGEEQIVLREKQDLIIDKAGELVQSAENVLHVSKPEGDEPKELCNIKQLVQSVLNEFFKYAQSRGVTLRPNLDDVEPIVLYKYSTLRALKNVIHNAIKYSHRGGVVEIVLSLERGEKDGTGKMVYVEVKDTGKGIPEEDQGTIFELGPQGDGPLEPGSGLGLYLARKAARRQDGDVILVCSSLNQGSVFRIILPYRAV